MLQRTLGVGGAEGLSAAANVFLGMVEAPLFIKPYLHHLARGKLFSLMTYGISTIAVTVLVLYASVLTRVLPDAMGHPLVATIIGAPASIAIAKIMIPASHDQQTAAIAQASSQAGSSMEAISNGTIDGIKLLINIIAMLVV
jgi:CNT family concentrative nucleoside transporter